MIDSSRGIKGFFPTGAACWSMDDTPSGLIDQYGNGNNLALGGVTPIPFPRIETNAGNSGYYYDGVNAKYLTTPDSQSLRPASVTCIVWYKHAVTPTSNMLFMKARGLTIEYSYAINIKDVAQRTFVFNLWDSAQRRTDSLVIPVPNVIYCIIGSADYTTLKSNIYVFAPGIKATGTLNLDAAGILYTAYPLLIGKNNNGTSITQGIIGQCGVLPYAISAQQASDYYKYETEPVKKYWIFDYASIVGTGFKYGTGRKYADGIHWGEQPSAFTQETGATASFTKETPETVTFTKETSTTVTYS